MADIEEKARREAGGQKEIPLSPNAAKSCGGSSTVRSKAPSMAGAPEGHLGGATDTDLPLIEDLQVYMREQFVKLSRGHDLAKAFNYILKRWASVTLLLKNGHVYLSNDAAERGLSSIALRRKDWGFCGSDRGGRRAASMDSLTKNERVDPQAWLTDILASPPPSSSAERAAALELPGSAISARAA
ncbi:hypothetical protein GGD67_002854 [Bradyrhizobium sp. IAR9]|nr:hypothetical protein [Bradyrhizobium sp. IAR9]